MLRSALKTSPAQYFHKVSYCGHTISTSCSKSQVLPTLIIYDYSGHMSHKWHLHNKVTSHDWLVAAGIFTSVSWPFWNWPIANNTLWYTERSSQANMDNANAERHLQLVPVYHQCPERFLITGRTSCPCAPKCHGSANLLMLSADNSNPEKDAEKKLFSLNLSARIWLRFF
jgi:hypothetical protein